MNNYMIYRLTWNAEEEKYEKKPVGLQGEPLLLGGGQPTSTDRSAVAATVARLGSGYFVGLWITPPLFFLDLDDCIVDGVLKPEAERMIAPLVRAGCYYEASSSGRGVHVIGSYHGQLPPHGNKRPTIHDHEFYVRDRGCVLSEAHQGDWHTDVTELLIPVVREWFPPRNEGVNIIPLTSGPRANWRGPTDDNVLIARMLSATGSAVGRMQGKVSLAQLWRGDCEHDSESDMALASHLAFWTGCDAERIERLMRRSGLVRDKWDEHRTYLMEKTITQACVTTQTVYQEPQRVDAAAALLGTIKLAERPAPTAAVTVLPADPLTDWFDIVEDAVHQINSAGTYKELMSTVLPPLGQLGLPRLHGDTVCAAVKRKVESFGTTHSIAHIRSLVMPVRDETAIALVTAPEWAQNIIFVLKGDHYYDLVTGSEYTAQGIKNTFSRFMPMKQNGSREDPTQWLSERWNMPTVDDLEYRPDQPMIFESSGRRMGNSFRSSTMPTPAVGSDECSVCIDLFQRHLYDIVNRRDEIYAALLGWIAHNVQHPGVKIRWTPLIKGVPGDGKSIIGDVLRSALGAANVRVTSPSTLSNSGGFTDWALGGCVNIIEEIRLEGKERRKLYNAMKTIIGDDKLDVNRKGRATHGAYDNITNHLALTNYDDGMPVTDGERRYTVIFTPWPSAHAAARIKGLGSADDLPRYFKRLGQSMKAEPGAWRAWLMSLDLSSFDPDSRAPHTEERDAMMHSSEDFTEQTVRDAIERGSTGVTNDVFCSASLMKRVEIDLGEKPDTRSWNRILTDLGYRQVGRVDWMGKTRRIWAKYSMKNAEIIEKLDLSATPRRSVG